MSLQTLGNHARKTYIKWLHRENDILYIQQRKIILGLSITKGYITNAILEGASKGETFRRFYYNELDRSNLYYKPVSMFEIDTILKNEELNIIYEKNSFDVKS